MSKAGRGGGRPAHQAPGHGRDHHRGQERPRPTRPHEAAVDSMLRLNGPASRVFRWAGVRACTDITGFGLLGAPPRWPRPRRALPCQSSAVPALEGALDYVRAKHVPGGWAVTANTCWQAANPGPPPPPARRSRRARHRRASMSRDLLPALRPADLGRPPRRRSRRSRLRRARRAGGPGRALLEIGEVLEGRGIGVV